MKPRILILATIAIQAAAAHYGVSPTQTQAITTAASLWEDGSVLEITSNRDIIFNHSNGTVEIEHVTGAVKYTGDVSEAGREFYEAMATAMKSYFPSP